MTLRSRMQAFVLWLAGESDDTADLRTFWAEQVREAARDRTPDDHYSKKYMREVRRRIINGGKPVKPLVEARPQLARFMDELAKRRMG